MQYFYLLTKLLFFSFVFLFTGIGGIHAQYENEWLFGSHSAITFNTNPPTAFKATGPLLPGYTYAEGMQSDLNCASVCDSNGKLLFYTDGYYAWNKNFELMPHGDSLFHTIPGLPPRVNGYPFQTTYGLAANWGYHRSTGIVPVPSHPGRYYIFSIGNFQYGYLQGWWGELVYCVVDMSLDNGLGDVIDSTRRTLVGRFHLETMSTVAGNDCNVWLLTEAQHYPAQIWAYNIDADSVHTVPVVSELDGFTVNPYGSNIEVSPDRSKVAIHGAHSYANGVAIFSFDPNTGKVGKNPIVGLDGGDTYCFSPDNSKVYTTGRPPDSLYVYNVHLFQFDLSSGDTSLIKASKTDIIPFYAPVDSVKVYRDVKRGPDGKIYWLSYNWSSRPNGIDVINYPNLPGQSCGFDTNVVHYQPRPDGRSYVGFSAWQFPNYVTPANGENTTAHTYTADTIYCADSFSIIAKDTTGTRYKWMDRDPSGFRRTIYESGIYTLVYHTYDTVLQRCIEHIDRFDMVIYHIKKTYATTSLSGACATDTLTLEASHLNGRDYTWNDGTAGATKKINQTGVYWVGYWGDSICEYFVDSFMVTYPLQEPEVSFTADTLICAGTELQFTNTSSEPYNIFQWTFGDGDSSGLKEPAHTYPYSGSYPVMLVGQISDRNCRDTAKSMIIVDSMYSPQFAFSPNQICAGEGGSFYPMPMDDSRVLGLNWHFGHGDHFTAPVNQNVQHAFDRPGRTEVTLVVHARVCPDTSYTDTVHVYAIPKVYLGTDTSLCLGSSPVTLYNQFENAPGIYHYLWNNGDTTEHLRVVHPGTYSLRVSAAPIGCSNTASVYVAKDCYLDIPNAFSPNGDGVDDYFLPRQLLSKGVVAFQMDIYNRWGAGMFVTDNVNGRGWDGRLNGQLQPQGVYVYLITVTYDNGRQEHYKGNVTLIR